MFGGAPPEVVVVTKAGVIGGEPVCELHRDALGVAVPRPRPPLGRVLVEILVNAGGVTVSYFEWLKNLGHVRLGRMNKRYDQHGKITLVKAIERNTGRNLSKAEKEEIIGAADEETLVQSGLEETMINAYHEVRNASVEKSCSLRKGAFIVAIRKIGTTYAALGTFPG